MLLKFLFIVIIILFFSNTNAQNNKENKEEKLIGQEKILWDILSTTQPVSVKTSRKNNKPNICKNRLHLSTSQLSSKINLYYCKLIDVAKQGYLLENNNDKNKLYELCLNKYSHSLGYISFFPKFCDIKSRKLMPAANNDLYITTFYSITDGDLKYLWRIRHKLLDENTSNQKLVSIINMLKNRAITIIDFYPISRGNNFKEQLGFLSYIREIYEISECTDFIINEIASRVITLRRRKISEKLLLPLNIILFAAGELDNLKYNPSSEQECALVITFMSNNSRIKLSRQKAESMIDKMVQKWTYPNKASF